MDGCLKNERLATRRTRLALRVAQQVFGRHDNQGLAELAVDLPTQQVKVVGRRGDVGDLPVAALDLAAQVPTGKPLALVNVGQHVGLLIRHLQKALEACTAMLRTLLDGWGAYACSTKMQDCVYLAVVAMGQQAHQPSLTQPLGLAAAQKLVENDLCREEEIFCVTNARRHTHLRAVGKVTKLGLPQHQAVGVFHAVAQLKA